MLGEAEVDDMLDIRYGERGLGNVGGEDDLPDARLTLLEYAAVLLPRDRGVDGQDPQRAHRFSLTVI